MPEAPEINVLVRELRHIIPGTVYRCGKMICIVLPNKKITIHLMLRGNISLERKPSTVHTLVFSNVTVYVNDIMKLAAVKHVKQLPTVPRRGLFVGFCRNHPNTMIGNALNNFKIGVGKYLTKEIFGGVRINPRLKCMELTDVEIKKIESFTYKLISHITKLHGKHTFKDIYGKSGNYYPKY